MRVSFTYSTVKTRIIFIDLTEILCVFLHLFLMRWSISAKCHLSHKTFVVSQNHTQTTFTLTHVAHVLFFSSEKNDRMFWQTLVLLFY